MKFVWQPGVSDVAKQVCEVAEGMGPKGKPSTLGKLLNVYLRTDVDFWQNEAMTCVPLI